MNYQEANEKLTGRCKQRRKVGNNTYLERRENAAIALHLHSTDVVTFHLDGAIVLDSGGWRTPTTKDRINGALGGDKRRFSLSQENGTWFLFDRDAGKHGEAVAVYQDGMRILSDGKLAGHLPLSTYKESLKLRRRVQRFAGAYLKAMEAGKVPAPSNGDCWYCLMRGVEDKVPLGESCKDTDHLLSHIEERYFVPSMLVRAMEVMPCSKVMGWAVGEKWGAKQESAAETFEKISGRHGWWSNYIRRDLQKCLSRYMLRQLGQAA